MIPFNRPLITNEEISTLSEVFKEGRFSGGGRFHNQLQSELRALIGCKKAFLTPSCTTALEMIALAINIRQGDEIIVPSFTHVSTVNSFVKYGGIPVWIDIKMSDLCINEDLIEGKITNHTKAIIAVHYGGFSCQLQKLKALAQKHDLFLIEDCAQGIGSSYEGKVLGSYGDFSVMSFHETKNIHCGEGGALFVNRTDYEDISQKIHDRGTDREEFNQKKVKQYTWHSSGSNYSLPEISSAFLYTQFQQLNRITQKRVTLFNSYLLLFSEFINKDKLPSPINHNELNGHCFYILTETENERNDLIKYLYNKGIQTVFHFQPLHLAPYWKGQYDNVYLPVTEIVANTIIRFPMFYNLDLTDIEYISNAVQEYYSNKL